MTSPLQLAYREVGLCMKRDAARDRWAVETFVAGLGDGYVLDCSNLYFQLAKSESAVAAFFERCKPWPNGPNLRSIALDFYHYDRNGYRLGRDMQNPISVRCEQGVHIALPLAVVEAIEAAEDLEEQIAEQLRTFQLAQLQSWHVAGAWSRLPLDVLALIGGFFSEGITAHNARRLLARPLAHTSIQETNVN